MMDKEELEGLIEDCQAEIKSVKSEIDELTTDISESELKMHNLKEHINISRSERLKKCKKLDQLIDIFQELKTKKV